MKSLTKNVSGVTGIMVVCVFIFLVLLDGFIFYYKYSYALNPNAASVETKVRFYLDSYKSTLQEIVDESMKIPDKLEAYSEIDKSFGEYAATHAIVDVYLLKSNESGNLSVVASSDKSMIGEDAVFEDCGIASSTDILRLTKSGLYYYQKMLPENRVFACAFEPVEGYVLGVSGIVGKSLSGFDDPDFKEWFVKNLSLTLIATILGACIGFLCYFWILSQYFRLKKSYEEARAEYGKRLTQAELSLDIDEQTGLLNRRKLEKDLATSLKNTRVVIIDIDDFASMSGFYGPRFCAEVIARLSAVLKEIASDHSMQAYRIEYDQFCLLQNGDAVTPDVYEELANDIIERFKGRIINITDSEGLSIQNIEVNITMGMCISNEEQALTKAYIALKYAKMHKRDYISYFHGLSALKLEYNDRINQSKIIKNAILNNEVTHFYQPIFDENKEVLRYEMLMRINDNSEPISPHFFLQTARSIKRYEDLELMMLDRVEQSLVANQDLVVSINLNLNDAFLQNISNRVLKMASSPNIASRLWVELAIEKNSTEDMPRLLRFVSKLRTYGVRVAIDDFGIDSMGLFDIITLAPELIKIDSAITKNVDTDEQNRVVLETIVRFARACGTRVGAKYIHSKDVFEICKACGVDEFQGNYLGLPSASISGRKNASA